MTRIIAGVAGGRRLRTPKGAATRPTTDRVREAVFSSLEADIGSLADYRFLDLFAGSGAVGLEARSRGASYALLVESSRVTAAVTRVNVEALGLGSVEVLESPAERLSSRPPFGGPYDVVFADPPYSYPASRLSGLLSALSLAGWYGRDARLVVERPSRDTWNWPAGVLGLRERKYGETTVWHGLAAPVVDPGVRTPGCDEAAIPTKRGADHA